MMMVEKEALLVQVDRYLSSFGVEEEQREVITQAMRTADRRFFVDEPRHAYQDTALPVGMGQTVSQPSTVARMLQLAELSEGLEVLEVGSGSGWNAALAATIVHPARTTSLELVPSLSQKAHRNVEGLRYWLSEEEPAAGARLGKLSFRNQDVFELVEEEGGPRYDRVLITAGIVREQEKRVLALARALLKEGGVMVCPYERGPMLVTRKQDGRLSKEYTKEAYAFVPLKGSVRHKGGE